MTDITFIKERSFFKKAPHSSDCNSIINLKTRSTVAIYLSLVDSTHHLIFKQDMILLSNMIVIKKIKDPLFSIQSSSDLRILLLFYSEVSDGLSGLWSLNSKYSCLNSI